MCAYFVTWRLASGQPPLSFDERSLVASALLHFQGVRYDLDAFVVMDDHVHAVVSLPPGMSLESVLHSWKSYTAHQVARQRQRPQGLPIWQDEFFDRVIRSDREFGQKVEYIAGNPWKRWPAIPGYQWVWVGGEEDRRRLMPTGGEG